MKRIILFALLTVVFTAQHVYAAPAYPHPVAYTLPDGSEITICLKGDESVSWRTSLDGYTLLFNADGYLEYAAQNAVGDLVLSGVRAHNEVDRVAKETTFLKSQAKGLKYSASQMEAMPMVKSIYEESVRKAMQEAPRKAYIGDILAPVILVDFPNVPFSKRKADFEMLINQENYTEGDITGSLYDYYLANSYGKCRVKADVFGPYRMKNDIIFYDSKSDGDPRLMAKEALDAADPDCDFSKYMNENGVVESFHIIYAGYGQEAGGQEGMSIWPHKWSMANIVEKDGAKLSTYSCSSELEGYSGSHIAYIGAIAHELGHSLFGLPDFYDTDYEKGGGLSVDLGSWDIMADGSWNDGGRTPSYFSAYGRDYCGWVEAVTLESPANITLPHPDSAGVIYRINTDTVGEYFLIENRQKTGWDEYIPSNGMLIYHVRENHRGWFPANTLLCNPKDRGCYVKQAGGGIGSNSFTRTTDPFPQANNSSFTDESIPNSKSWSGKNTNRPITEIGQRSKFGTVSFKFMGGTEETDPAVYGIEMRADTITLSRDYAYTSAGTGTYYALIENTGNRATGNLQFTLSGEHPEAFEFSENERNIFHGGEYTLAVKPVVGLSVGTYRATVTVSGDHDLSKSFYIVFIVKRASGSAVSIPVLASRDSSSIRVKQVTLSKNTGQDIEYAIDTNADAIANKLTWQSDTAFTGLVIGTPYYVYARSVADENCSAGKAERSAKIQVYPATVEEQLNEASSIQAWVRDDVLYIKGLTTGTSFRIYSISGALIHEGIVTDDPTQLSCSILGKRGMYILRVGDRSLKFVW